jgi:pimeloyl-ACP methyl ester carboxylesterase
MTEPSLLPPIPLPAGISFRFVDTSPHSLNFHILEAGHSPDQSRPLILLVHGFPELAYSWRHTMPLLASAGYYVVAFDQRGYGRTYSPSGPIDHSDFRPLNLIRDVIILVHALGYTKVKCIVGHDFGAVTAALCALARPDFFSSLVLMSHPTKGPPTLPFNTANGASRPAKPVNMDAELAKLDRPRKHYKWYYCTPLADSEMTNPASGLDEFLRGYFHLKSADWAGNDPHPLKGWEASELAKMPRYYIMDKADTMREAVARDMKTEDPEEVRRKSKRWLSDDELSVYVGEYARNGFQGGLNWYKVQTQPKIASEMDMFGSKKIEMPCLFVSGRKDWGSFQEPGALENMVNVCSNFRGAKYVEGAGHWLPQEQPEEAVRHILEVVNSLSA